MKNIHIPKKFFIVLLIFAIAMMLIGLFTGCSTDSYSSTDSYKSEVKQDNERFQIAYIQNYGTARILIIIDNETNVKYMCFRSCDGGVGLTKLEE